MSIVMDNLKEAFPNMVEKFKPFEEILNEDDEKFDKIYPTFKQKVVNLLQDKETEKFILDTVKTAPHQNIEDEYKALNALYQEIDEDESLSENKKDLLRTIFKMTTEKGLSYISNPRERVPVKILKVYDDVILPKYAHDTDAGADIYSYDDVIVQPGETKLIHTGLKMEFPAGYEVQIRNRSGNSLKTKIRIANAPATIDSSYRGEIGIIIDNIGKEPFHIEKGFKLAQMLIAPTPMMEFTVVDELSTTDRGEKGYGSTDRS